MELHQPGIAPIGRVDRAPRAGAAGNGGLLVVHPKRRRHAAEPHEAGGVAAEPGEHVLRPRPDDRLLPTPRKHHVQRHQVDRRVADDHCREVRPVHLRLRPGRRLDPTPRPDGRRREGAPPVSLYRAQAAVITMLPPQPLVQCRQIYAISVLLPAPVLDRHRKRLGLRPLPRPPIEHPSRHPPAMVAHRAFRHAQAVRFRSALIHGPTTL